MVDGVRGGWTPTYEIILDVLLSCTSIPRVTSTLQVQVMDDAKCLAGCQHVDVVDLASIRGAERVQISSRRRKRGGVGIKVG